MRSAFSSLLLWLAQWWRYQKGVIALKYRTGHPDHLAKICAVDGMITAEEAQLLYRLAGEVVYGCIVEIGSFHGKSTVALVQGSAVSSRAAVYSIDPYRHFAGPLGGVFGPHDKVVMLQSILLAGVAEHVSLIHRTSEQAANGWDEPVGLLWVDGDHTHAGVLADYRCWNPFIVPRGIMALHDSTNPDLGPFHLARAIVTAGEYEQIDVVGGTTVLRKLSYPQGGS